MRRLHQPGDSDPRSILVVLPTWVGDFVMATPTLRAIRRRFGDAHITFLIEPNLRDLAGGGDWANEWINLPMNKGNGNARSPLSKPFRDLVWDLRRRRFDWAVLLSNSFRSALIAWLAGATRRFGYDRDGRGLLLTDKLPCINRRNGGTRSRGGSEPRPPGSGQQRYPSLSTTQPVKMGTSLPVKPTRFLPMPLVEYYADLAEAIGCDRPGDRFELVTTPDDNESVESRLRELGIADRRPLVVISPGAKYGSAKCWLPQRFAAVADRLIESDNATVIVTCGPGEELIARGIGSAMKREGMVLDSPLLTLGQLKSLIARSDLLICNDAGPRHIGKAFDIPVVTVLGPTHPDWTATAYAAERIVRVDVDCGPCQQRVCPLGHLDCIMGVTVEAVEGACRELLAARAAAVAGAPVIPSRGL
ncbi:MAG: glycosyltransferase family 9 protein [Planctomycetes bacterium]|nr:glycosyltransferase family 9 protein [Planctomycetota bacterium]